VDLVQRHLQNAGGDLDRAGEAGGRRQDEGERVGRQAAVGRHALDQPGRRLAVGLEHEGRRGSVAVAVAELRVELLPRHPRPARAGGHREVGVRTLAEAQRPARVLRGEAGQDRVGAADDDPERRALGAAVREVDPAEAAHADLGDPPPGLDAAAGSEAGIDDRGTPGSARDAQAEGRRVREQRLHERRGQPSEARLLGLPHIFSPPARPVFRRLCVSSHRTRARS
jgi:hypothetical protein